MRAKTIILFFVLFSSCFGKEYRSLVEAGDLYMSRADYRNAAKAWTDADRLQPGSPDLLNKIGVAYTLWGRYEKALAFFDSLIAIQPQNARAYFNKGALFLRWNRPKDALDQFTLCSIKEPLYPEAHYHKGFIYQRQRKWTKALEEYKHELNLNTISAKAWRGYLLARQELRLERGKSRARTRISPEVFVVFLIIISVLGWVLYFAQHRAA